MHRKAVAAKTAAPDPMRARKSTMVTAADMCAVAVPAAMAVAATMTMTTTAPSAMTTATFGDRGTG
jgi:hypothetical protein